MLAWYFVAVWGSGYIATKIGLHYAAPFTFLALRFCFGLLCLIPIVFLWKTRWPRNPSELGHLVVAGLLMHAVQLGGSHYAQYLGMSAGVTALIISCQPLLTALIASRFLKEHLLPGQWLGVVIGLVHIYVPFMVLTLVGVIGRIDPTLEEAARGLGASRLRTFLEVTLPLSLPGILAGSLLVFALAISAYVTPVLLGGNNVLTLPMLIYQQVSSSFNLGFAGALGVVLLAVSLALVFAYNTILGRLTGERQIA